MQDLAADFIINNTSPIEFEAEISPSEHFDCSFEIHVTPDISHLATKEELADAVEQLEEEIAQATLNIEGSKLIDVQRTDDTTVISSKTFVFEQAVPSTEWIINHNLNKRPSIDLTYYSGESFEAYREYVNDNQVIIRLENAATGYAYLN